MVDNKQTKKIISTILSEYAEISKLTKRKQFSSYSDYCLLFVNRSESFLSLLQDKFTISSVCISNNETMKDIFKRIPEYFTPNNSASFVVNLLNDLNTSFNIS